MSAGDAMLLVLIGTCLLAEAHWAARAALTARTLHVRRWALRLCLRIACLLAAWAALIYLVRYHGG